VLVHMSRPLTKQMGCPVNGYEKWNDYFHG